MLSHSPTEIYISTANVDMRKGIDGFASIVEQQFRCDKIKLLYWDGDGYCLLYKRIERGRFRFPRKLTGDTFTVSREELDWLMHGLSIEEMRHYNRLKGEDFSTERELLNMA